MDEATAIRRDEQLDWAMLERWLRNALQLPDEPMEVAQFTAGHANLTYSVAFGAEEFIVRRPPRGSIAPGAHDMAREHRVLSRLGRHFDRAPLAIAFCDDHTVIGAPFVVVERRRGVVVRSKIPAEMADHTQVPWRISMALIDAMAALHAVCPQEVGLGELGRPEGFLDRQLGGWSDRWRHIATRSLPVFDAVHASLVATRPTTSSVALVHNDLKLDNCMFDPTNPDRVQSIFDWDMTTLGDPLVDLGILLSYWRQPDDLLQRAPSISLDMASFPSRADLVSQYETCGVSVSHVEWYEAFGLWRQAVVLEQLFARFDRGESTDSRMAALGPAVPDLVHAAAALLS